MQKKKSEVATGSFKTPFTEISKATIEKKFKPIKKNPDFNPEKRAFLTLFKNQPNLAVILFKPDRAKARWGSCKYFREQLHPDFLTKKDYDSAMYQTITKRIPQFDKYHKEEKVPIVELMKVLGATFNCSCCGKKQFKYENYEAGQCFILEGEGDLNDFTKGLVLCYDCYRKLTM